MKEVDGVDIKEMCKKLLEREEKLTNEIYSFSKNINDIYDEIRDVSMKFIKCKDEELAKKREMLYEKARLMEKRKTEIVKEFASIKEKLLEFIDVLDDESVLVGENVDLYKSVMLRKDEYDYKICLHGDKKVIGTIIFKGEPDKLYPEYDGNIGYSIDEEYRRKGYASDALMLLCDKLHKDGVKEVYVAMTRRNYASQRVAEKCGGKLVNECCDDYKLLYKCDLRNLKEIKKR